MLIKLAFIAIVLVVLGIPIYAVFRRLWNAGKEEEAMGRLKKELEEEAKRDIESDDIEKRLRDLRAFQQPLGNQSQQERE